MSAKAVILGVLIWLILFILLFIPLLFLVLYKVCVVLVAKIFRRDLISITGADAMNIPGYKDDHYAFFSFGWVLQVEGDISLESVRKLFNDKILAKGARNEPRFQKFHCALVSFGGFPFLQRLSNFKITEQIYVKPLNEETQVLEDILSEWLYTNYKKNSPCWEIIVVPMRGTNQTAIALKIHHVLADLYSLVYVLDKLANNTSPYLVKDFNETFREKMCQIIQAPFHLVMAMKKNPSPNIFPGTSKEAVAPYLAFSGFDLTTLKQIRRKHNVRFASIILSVLVGALRRYLLESKSPSELPINVRIAVTLPWPNHPSKSKLPNITENARLCNHFTVGMLEVPLGELSASKRLEAVENALLKFEDTALHKFLKRVLVPAVCLSPISLFPEPRDRDIGAIGYSMSVGGSDYQILGNRVNRIHIFQAIENLQPPGLVVVAFSHSNNFDVSFTLKHCPDRTTLNRIANEYTAGEIRKLFDETFPAEV